MIITKVTLDQFGPHKHVEVDFPCGLVGLVGANSRGKTTILKALEFALTGSLPGNAETYVRRTTEEQAANGTVVVEFVKGGRVGKIRRRVGKSPMRELVWDGATIKKGGDIDRILAEILNADKQAIANAIFLSQGEIGKILFSRLSEREQLFQRLLLVGYMPTIEAAADTQIRLLESTIEDYGVVMDEIRQQRTSAEVEQEAAQRDIPGDVAETLKLYRNLAGNLKSSQECNNRLEAAITTARGKAADYGPRIEELSLNLAAHEATCIYPEEFIANAQLNTTSEWLRDKAVRLREAVQPLVTRVAHVEAVADLQAAQIQSTKDLEVAQQESKAFTEELNGLPKNAAQLLEAQRALTKARADETEAAHASAQAEIDLRTTTDRLPEMDEHRKAMAEAEAQSAVISPNMVFVKQQINFLEALDNAKLAHGSDDCPFCNSKVDVTKLPGLDKLRPQYAEAVQKLDNLRATWKRHSDIVKDFEPKHAAAQTASSNARTVLGRRTAERELREKVDIAGFLQYTDAQLETWISRQTVLRANIDTGFGRIVEAEKRRTVAIEKLKLTSANIEKVALPELRRHLEAARNEWATFVQFADRWREIHNDIATKRAQIDTDQRKVQEVTVEAVSLNEAWRTLCAAVRMHGSKIPLYDPATLDMLGIDMEIAELDRINAIRVSKLAAVQQIQAQIAGFEKRLAELDKIQEAQEATRRVISELGMLRTAFSKQGLPATFLHDRFQRLNARTNANLSQMQANFSVRPSTEEPLSFQFLQLDTPGTVWLEQSQLSGGQRIRLSVAFLVAVQQLVIPDVGLLVMDEPSTHLDAEGVDSMRDLLAVMAKQFAASEAQIIVCDHNPRLIPFDSPMVNLAK